MQRMTEVRERTVAWLWQQIEVEAKHRAEQEPVLASFYHAAILNHPSLAAALAYYLAARLGNRDVSAMLMRQVCDQTYSEAPELIAAAAADICAHVDRDPACDDYAIPLLFFKGFHAVQAYRVANWLWRQQRYSLASHWQNRVASVFDVDIHPAAQLGCGIMIDHATGLVIGETAEVGNDVSMLHGVTLGGCGRAEGRRHPRIGDGVLISAGAKLLGAISVGSGAKIAAGSVVLEDVPEHATVAGVPAKIVGRARGPAPALDMDQTIDP